MVSQEKFGISPFDSNNENFNNRKFRIQLALKSERVHGSIVKKTEKPNDDKEDILVQTIIVVCMAYNVLENMKDCTTTFDM